jgi:hypothetical protein
MIILRYGEERAFVGSIASLASESETGIKRMSELERKWRKCVHPLLFHQKNYHHWHVSFSKMFSKCHRSSKSNDA